MESPICNALTSHHQDTLILQRIMHRPPGKPIDNTGDAIDALFVTLTALADARTESQKKPLLQLIEQLSAYLRAHIREYDEEVERRKRTEAYIVHTTFKYDTLEKQLRKEVQRRQHIEKELDREKQKIAGLQKKAIKEASSLYTAMRRFIVVGAMYGIRRLATCLLNSAIGRNIINFALDVSWKYVQGLIKGEFWPTPQPKVRRNHNIYFYQLDQHGPSKV